MRKIICIGRQFGSGGHLIAKRFAKQAGIEYYDRRIVERAIEVSGMARGIMGLPHRCRLRLNKKILARYPHR